MPAFPPLPPPNEALAELAEILGDDDAKEIVRSFLREFPATLRSLVGAERSLAHRLAHGLKSSARHIGVLSLSRRMASLEARLAEPDGEVASDELAHAFAEFEQAAKPLRRYADS